jgi:hypothetical protein
MNERLKLPESGAPELAAAHAPPFPVLFSFFPPAGVALRVDCSPVSKHCSIKKIAIHCPVCSVCIALISFYLFSRMKSPLLVAVGAGVGTMVALGGATAVVSGVTLSIAKRVIKRKKARLHLRVQLHFS